jgi:hypothetical protein
MITFQMLVKGKVVLVLKTHDMKKYGGVEV